MIPRYTRPAMAAIWTDENKFSVWLKIEVLACEALHRLGQVPAADLKRIQQRAKFEVKRIDEIEREVNHDVIAFLTNVAEHRRSLRALHPQGPDQLRRARYRAGRADGAGGRPADRRT
jgi:adenylosuccinate lyase